MRQPVLVTVPVLKHLAAILQEHESMRIEGTSQLLPPGGGGAGAQSMKESEAEAPLLWHHE